MIWPPYGVKLQDLPGWYQLIAAATSELARCILERAEDDPMEDDHTHVVQLQLQAAEAYRMARLYRDGLSALCRELD